ncbi:MAG: esterase-like activity of phytase family protein [Ideonella sp.]|nr:esterase-like activity of phytase family protein [Ideonella sp.]
MFRTRLIALAATAALVTSAAMAAPTLIARGSLSGNLFDLAASTHGALENGVAGNLLGGIGSGLAWAGGNTFLGLPDRGPNATAYNSAVDDTTSYIARYQSLTMSLAPAAAGSALPLAMTPTLTGTTLLSSPTALSYGSGVGLGTRADGTPMGSGAPSLNAVDGKQYFSGRSDNFDPAKGSLNADNGRLDPESIRVSADGKSVFISDEYGPYVYQFDRATGARLRSFALPANLGIAKLSPVGSTEITGNSSGRVANKGMEGLAITPDGKSLVGIMQAPLIQDAAVAASNKLVRIVTIDIATGATHEYGYKLTDGSGVSEIVALNDHQFLVDERDGKGLGDGSTAKVKKVYLIDIAGATDITGLSGAAAANAAVAKSQFLDLVSALNVAGGISDPNQVPAKIEGMAFGEDVVLNGSLMHTLFVANDNDFVQSVAGDNQFFVFGFTDQDLSAVRAGAFFQQQAIATVPEPASAALVILCLLGLSVAQRYRRDQD